jgi:hypothetical protein
VIGDVWRVQVDDSDEAWERDIEVDDGEARWVGATRSRVRELPVDDSSQGGWNVTVAAMEFVTEEPLEGELRRRIATTLRSVEDVQTAEEMDREVWFVTGTPSGEALVRAVAEVLDEFAEQTSAQIRG